MTKIKAFLALQLAKISAYLKSAQFKAQVSRAIRLFAMTALVSLLGLFKSHALTPHAIGAALVAAAEVVFRIFVPAADPKSPYVATHLDGTPALAPIVVPPVGFPEGYDGSTDSEI